MIETGDFAGAAARLNDFKTIGVLDRDRARDSGADRPARRARRPQPGRARRLSLRRGLDQPAGGGAGRLREIALRYASGESKKPQAIDALEQLTTSWRGDETEVEALQMLAKLYTEENRYRDAFHTSCGWR